MKVVDEMDKAKILRLCNEIEDAVNEVAACCEIIDLHTHKMMIDKLREIGAEISAPPKSNGDRIRAMTDEELVRFLRNYDMCIVCQVECTKEYPCNKGIIKWLKQEVQNNDG